MRAAPLLALALLAPPARAAGDAPLFDSVSRRDIAPEAFDPPVTPAAKVVPLTLVVEAGSGWDQPKRLEVILSKASRIFTQCGISLGATEVLSARWSAEGLRRLNNKDPYAGPPQMAVMSEPRIPRGRPIGFLFAEGSIPSTAQAHTVDTVNRFATTFPDARKLLNTFWITFKQEVRPPRPDEDPSYSTFAHELAHLFGNITGHTRERPNLMAESSDPGSKSGYLSPAQCVEVRKLHGLP